jgi:DNA primase large subunit
LLLTRARVALAKGDAASAVADLRAAEQISGRQLVPEELSMESQALRVLGRDREADARESELRSRYPESALAR